MSEGYNAKPWLSRLPIMDDAGYCSICQEHLDSGRCEGHCENETCDHVSHCDDCGRGFNFELPEGNCMDCQIRWRAKNQLGGSDPETEHIKRMLTHAKDIEDRENLRRNIEQTY